MCVWFSRKLYRLFKVRQLIKFLTFCSVHFHPTSFTRPPFRFFKGLAPRQGCMLLKLTAHLSHWSQTPLKLELIDSHVGWLSALCSSTNFPLPPSTTYTHSVNDVPLFRLVSQSASFIWPRGSRCTMYGGQLSVLPASHTQKKAKQVRLLLTPKFLQILIGTHFCPRKNRKRAINITVTYLQLSYPVDCSNKKQIYPPSSLFLSFPRVCTINRET